MTHPCRLLSLAALASLFAACSGTLDDPDTQSDEQALTGEQPCARRIQPGANLVALGVTDDARALYWDAGAVYATELTPWARRELVTQASAPPMTMIVGRVALIWTDQLYFGPPAPSPLVVWTSARGAWTASDASLPPVIGQVQALTAVSPDGRQAIFATHVSADGTRGDIVRADLAAQRTTTLVANADVDPFGACPPHTGFDRGARVDVRARGLAAIVMACRTDSPGDAALSIWPADTEVELAKVRAGRWWVTDASGQRLFAVLADRTPAVFDLEHGGHTVIDPSPVSLGWMSPDGVVFTATPSTSAGRELRRTVLYPEPRTETLVSLPSGAGFGFSNHLAQGIPHYGVSTVPTSPDGRFLIAFTTADFTTGLTNAVLIDTSEPHQTPLVLEATPITTASFENATRDSRHALIYTIDASGADALIAVSRTTGEQRRLSTGPTVFAHYALTRGKVAFSDGTIGNPGNLLSTTDLRVADTNAADLGARLIAPAAHPLFFPTHGRRAMVYTTDAGSPGLYVAPVP